MGISSKNPLLVSLNLKGKRVDGNNKEITCNRALEAQARRRWQVRVMTRNRPRTRRSILMKRRACPDGLRRTQNCVGKRVRNLKKLIPDRSESKGLDGLFRETADYILSLQTRVKVMQILVKALSTTGSDDQ